MIAFYRPSAGVCAAAIGSLYGNIDYSREIGYGSALPMHLIHENEPVYLFGISFNRQEMEYLCSKCPVTFIDHRQENIDFVNSLNMFNITMICNPDEPMSVQTWKHFCPHKEVPKAVELFGNYMMWRLNPEVLSFHYGCVMLDMETSDIWKALILNTDNIVEKTIERGSLYLQYIDILNTEVANDLIYPTTMDGVPILAANIRMSDSLFFTKVNTEGYELAAQYHWVWETQSFRINLTRLNKSVGYSAAVMAKKYGGNGTEGAAGIVIKDIKPPFRQMAIRDDEPFHQIWKYTKSEELLTRVPRAVVQMAEQQKRKNGWAQYTTTINGQPVSCLNYPTLDWVINPKHTSISDYQISWVWESGGRYRLMVLPLTPSFNVSKLGLGDPTVITENGIHIYHKGVLPNGILVPESTVQTVTIEPVLLEY